MSKQLKMTATRYLQVWMIISFTVAEPLILSCEPGEEFKSHNITWDVTGNDTVILWRNNYFYLSSCSLQPTPNCDPPSGPYVTTIMGQTVTLNILNVTRLTEGNYSCSNGRRGVPCDFRVYAKPESVTCQVPQLQSNMVMVACTVAKIYPSLICQFSWFKNGTEMSLPNQNITYQNMSGQGQPDYFYQTCNLTLPAQNLGLGSHAFKVRAYPNVTGNHSDTKYGVDGSQSPSVTINYPTVQLECPPGYVQDGSSFNCSCRETANSFLSATTTFSQGSTVKSSGPGFTTYTFTANRSNQEDLTCRATLLNWTSSIATYSPQVAYGPKNVTVKVSNLTESGDISLCDKSQPVTVTVTCAVIGNDISPGADFEFTINGSRRAANPVNGSSMTFSLTNSGILAVQCTGYNSVLMQITATSTELHVQVIEPPAAPPIIDKIQDSDSPAAGYLTVQEGNNKIRCRAEGGYPPVSSVIVNCGQLTNTSVGNVAFLDVSVNRSMDAGQCSCTATHSSPCYRSNTTVINLNVQFVPTIVSFTLNENTAQTEVDRNSGLVISCTAEGNPIPSLTLSKDGQQLNTSNSLQQKFTLSLMFNKTQTDCVDAGVYSCDAQTEEAVAHKSVDVNIRCQPQLENPNIQNKVYLGRLNSAITINISVIGYPEPSLYLDSSHDLNKDAYILTYISLGPSRGVVSLMISTVTTTVFQSYKLIMTNSLGILVYNFQIQEGPEPADDAGVNVGAVVGGVVAGIVVIVATVLAVVCLKRKGLLKKGVRNSNEAGSMLTHSTATQKAPHFENIQPTLPKANGLSKSEYEEIRDVHQQPQYEEIRVVHPEALYEEPIDVPPKHTHKNDVYIQPSSPDSFANRDFLKRHRHTVDYENTISEF